MAISGVILGILGMILTYVMMMILAQCHAFLSKVMFHAGTCCPGMANINGKSAL